MVPIDFSISILEKNSSTEQKKFISFRTSKNPGGQNRQRISVIKVRKAAARAQALTDLQDFGKALVEEVAGAVHRVIHAECRAALPEDRATHAEEALASCAAALAEVKKQVAFLESLRTHLLMWW